MAINHAPVIPNAVMLDAVLAQIQHGLINNLNWLDVAFGRCQRLQKNINGKRIISPNVYCGGWNGHGSDDYIEVSPDSHIGNFSFFEIEEPQTLETGPWARSVTAPFALLFWFDLRKVYGEPSNRNTEEFSSTVVSSARKTYIADITCPK